MIRGPGQMARNGSLWVARSIAALLSVSLFRYYGGCE